MAGLLDFLQSASNTAADTVAAPVDLLAWALRKAGVPVPQNAVGGTQWMTERGLRRDVQQSPASLAGETVGLLSPVVAAAKAPQIAKGLLQVEANIQDAPMTLAGSKQAQRGAIVWHGSPHKFDRFDSSKIGTGEGAQAYGHGLYLAETPDVAGSYIQAGRNVGFTNFDDPIRLANKAFGNAKGNTQEALKLLDDAISSTKAGSRQNNLIFAKRVIERGDQTASLYKVDIPDPLIARMLDWDKPLSQQAPEVQDIFSGLSRLGVDDPLSLPGGTAYRRMHEAAIRQGRPEPAAIKEAQMVRGLRTAGIPGIRYLDGGSRGAGAGTSNFVVFPSEENALSILERNGQGLLGR